MTATLGQNMFSQVPVQGMLDSAPQPSTLPCRVDSSSGGGLVPGQAVKMVDKAGGTPFIVECDVDTNDVFGFLEYNIKNQTFEVGDPCDVAMGRGNIMYMTAGAAIARWAKLEIVVASKKVLTHAGGGQRVIGRALDKAAADGDLIRVWIDLPGQTS